MKRVNSGQMSPINRFVSDHPGITIIGLWVVIFIALDFWGRANVTPTVPTMRTSTAYEDCAGYAAQHMDCNGHMLDDGPLGY